MLLDPGQLALPASCESFLQERTASGGLGELLVVDGQSYLVAACFWVALMYLWTSGKQWLATVSPVCFCRVTTGTALAQELNLP